MNPKKFCLYGHGGHIIVQVYILTKVATHKNKSTNIIKKNKYWFLFLYKNGFNKFDKICVKNTFFTIWYTAHSLEIFPSQTFSSVQTTNIILAKFAPTSNYSIAN